MVDPESLVEASVQDKFPDPESHGSQEYTDYKQTMTEQVVLQSSSFNSAAQLWDDGIVLPQDTRKVP